MPRSIVVAVSLLLMGASCEPRPSPPVPVDAPREIPVPCKIPEPTCDAPAYDVAKKEQDGDIKVRLLRAETAAYEDCLRKYRIALQACQQYLPTPR